MYLCAYQMFQVSEKLKLAKKWAKPHVETAKMVASHCP
jgi:hypothetical protein